MCLIQLQDQSINYLDAKNLVNIFWEWVFENDNIIFFFSRIRLNNKTNKQIHK